ncbi:uncharacterized protein LOC144564726 [Carex rostrata]
MKSNIYGSFFIVQVMWRLVPSWCNSKREQEAAKISSFFDLTLSRELCSPFFLKVSQQINTLMANGDLSALRKVVTEKMYSTLKNELKKREAVWSSVYWELEGSGLRLRTLRARMDPDFVVEAMTVGPATASTSEKF